MSDDYTRLLLRAAALEKENKELHHVVAGFRLLSNRDHFNNCVRAMKAKAAEATKQEHA